MTNGKQQESTGTAAEGFTAESMEKRITQLKGYLEEKRSRSCAKARWEGMIEDCELILNHLGSTHTGPRLGNGLDHGNVPRVRSDSGLPQSNTLRVFG
jgi:hypothetical protein